MALRRVRVLGELEGGAGGLVHLDEARPSLQEQDMDGAEYNSDTKMISPDSRKRHAETYRVVLLADAAEVPVVLRLHELLSRLAALEHQFLQQRTTRISSM
jgi:hypothetical protein